jgi:uncharacterized protein YkwD
MAERGRWYAVRIGRAGFVHAAGGGAANHLRNLGTARGGIVLAAQTPPTSNTWVVFVLEGPRRVIRVDASPPFALQLDTRTMPDGLYTLTEITFTSGKEPVARVSSLRIANGTASTPTAAQAAPGARPATPVSPSASAPTQQRPPTSTTGQPSQPTQPQAPTQTAAAPPPAGSSSFTAQVVTLTNNERAKAGCPALTANATLTSVAQAHSQDMATNNYFSHDSQDGRSPFDRMTAAGYTFRLAAENIAAGQSTPAAVVQAWMNSAGHRANILNCGLTQIGVGYAKGGSYGSYWTQDFGTPQ